MFFNSSHRSFDDRFIPNRKYNNLDLSHYKLISSDDDTKIKNDIFSIKPKKLHRYQELLQETINYYDRPIFSFSTKPKNFKKSEKSLKRQWPCIPRKYPIIKKPDIILDWPNTQRDLYWNIVDWGSNGYVATIWSRRVYLWHTVPSAAHQEEVTSTGIKGSGALRWSQKSTRLAVADTSGSFTIYAFPSLKSIFSSSCNHLESCAISAFCWDQTDSVIITGCSRGLIMSFGMNGDVRICIRAHLGFRILKLEINSNNKFVCSTGTDSLVRIWTWPKLEPHVEITYCNFVRAIAFHPWCPNLLCVGGGLGDGSLSLWNVISCEQIAYHVPVRESMVDCLAWNRVTGELVSSHLLLAAGGSEDLGDPAESTTKVLVLSGLDNVVDYIDDHHGRVVYLMWDKSGSKLATACSDESICIWNFLGSDLNRNKILGVKNRSELTRLEKCIR